MRTATTMVTTTTDRLFLDPLTVLVVADYVIRGGRRWGAVLWNGWLSVASH
jgi:hypothetical protein